MRIANLNPDTDIGASAWWVQIEEHRLLLDAGVHPKWEGREGLPMLDRIEDPALEAIVISHCHHDHVGALPVAMRRFPDARVFMSELSYFLVERVLHNSVNVMLRRRQEMDIREYPLYTHRELDEQAPFYQAVRYEREIGWAEGGRHRPRPTPTLELYDAGHVLGAAGVMVRGRQTTLFYTGDVCFHDQTLLRGARFDDVRADVLLMETTRGDREPVPGQTRQSESERLLAGIQRVLARGGNVLIPTFALGRTQEVLGQLALWMQAGALPEQPIYVGGLGRVFTEIYDVQAHRANRRHSSLELGQALDLRVLERGPLAPALAAGGQLFVLTAGMLTENTAAHEVAAALLPDPRHGIFLVGYVDPETPGGRLKESRPGEPFRLSDSAGEVVRECELEVFDLTAHAEREDLLEFVGVVSPEVVVLGHGNDASRNWFARAIRERYPRIRIEQPGPGEVVVI